MAHLLLCGLLEDGVKVILFHGSTVTDQGNNILESLSKQGAKCVDCKLLSNNKILGAVLDLIRLTKEVNPDAVVSFQQRDRIIALLASKFSQKKVILHIGGMPDHRGSSIRQLLAHNLLKYAYGKAEHIVVVNNKIKQYLIQEIQIPSDSIEVILNGIDQYELNHWMTISAETAQPFEKRKNNLDLLAVGRLVPVKGHDLLIKSLESINDIFLTLRIAGAPGPNKSDRDYLEILKNLALKSRHNILFMGDLPRNEIFSHLLYSDLYIQPSRSEGWSLALSEAMSSGKYVIFTDCAGVPNDLLETVNRNNSTPSVGNTQELAASIKQFISQSESENTRYTNKLKAFSEQHLNINTTVKKFNESVQSVITKNQCELNE